MALQNKRTADSHSTGWQIWKLFLMLDSYKHPLRTYGDIAFRVFGGWAKHIVSILQSIQLIVNVGLIILSSGQGIYQINPKICKSSVKP
jgi:transmembrane amino acid transporter